MVLTHGNVIFDIPEPSAFQKYSICWVFRAFFCSTFFYMYFATRPRPALTAVSRPSLKTSFCESSDPCQGPWEVEQCYTSISVGVIVMIKSLNQIACEASAEQIKRGGWILLSRLWANLTCQTDSQEFWTQPSCLTTSPVRRLQNSNPLIFRATTPLPKVPFTMQSICQYNTESQPVRQHI